MGIKIGPDVLQNIMSKVVQDMEYVSNYDDKLIWEHMRFKDLQLKLGMVLVRLSIFGESQCIKICVLCRKKKSIRVIRLSDRLFNQDTETLRLFLILSPQSLDRSMPVPWCSQLLMQHLVYGPTMTYKDWKRVVINHWRLHRI